MNIQQEVLRILDEVLQLEGRTEMMDHETPLMGALAELDSMSVMGLLAALEERFAFTITAQELDGSSFTSVGTLIDFVERKLGENTSSAHNAVAAGRGQLLTTALHAFLSWATVSYAIDA